MNILKKLIGDESTRVIKKWAPLVDKINQLESQVKELGDLDFITKYSDIITIYPVGEDIIYSLEECCQHNDCGIILIYLGIYMKEIAKYKERFFYLILGLLFLQTIKTNFNKLQFDNGISITYHDHQSKL